MRYLLLLLLLSYVRVSSERRHIPPIVTPVYTWYHGRMISSGRATRPIILT